MSQNEVQACYENKAVAMDNKDNQTHIIYHTWENCRKLEDMLNHNEEEVFEAS